MNEMNELTAYDVSYKTIPVTFNTYALYKQKAEELAERVKAIEVTEENIKDVKKDLAAVRKVSDALTDKRIEIKKELLKDFTVFENQVKEISAIIDFADRQVREKVRELEERERDEKEARIRLLWNERSASYELCKLNDFFYSFLRPQHLNKTTTMTQVENEMVEWLEVHERQWKVSQSMDIGVQTEFLGCLDIVEAMEAVNRRQEVEKTIVKKVEEQAMFVVKGKKDIELTAMLLKEHNIEFERR